MGDISKKLLGIFLGISLSIGVGASISSGVHGEATEVEGATEKSVELCVSINSTMAYANEYTITVNAPNFYDGTDSISIKAKGVYRQAKTNTYYQMNKKDGYLKNTVAMPGKITKIVATWSGNKGTTTCYFAENSEASSSNKTVTTTAAESMTYTAPTDADYYYFNIDTSKGSGSDQMTSCKVYYEEASTTVSPLASISLSAYTTEYYTDDEFSFDGKCLAAFEDGSSKTVTPTSVSTPDMSTAGAKTVTVSYTDPNDETNTKTAEYIINVTQYPYEGRGTEASPYTVTDAYTIASELATGANNGKVVYVKGVVSSDVSINNSRGTFDITDGKQTIKAYSITGVTNDSTKSSYVKKDYRVVVSGAIFNYDGALEVGYTSGYSSSLVLSKAPATLTTDMPETLDFNADGTFTATTDATNPTYAWSSSDHDLCVVENDGSYLAGSATGKVTITVSLTYDGCIIPVELSKEIEIVDPNVHTVTLTGDSTVKVGKTLQLTAECSKGDEITWTSSSVENATVSETGLVTGIAEGSATITATCANGDTATKDITIEPKDALFKKATSNSDLVVGKEVVIASSDGKYVMNTTQNTNNRGASEATLDDEYIVKTSTTAVFTLLPAKNNGFAFYDKTNKAMLASNSSSSNYLKTDGDYGEEKAYATVTISSGTATVKFQGSNTKNLLKKNSSSMLFSCYDSGQAEIAIYVAVEGDPETLGDTWAKQFNTTANCDPTGVRTLSSDKWTTLTTEFKAQSIPEKMAASYLDTESSLATTDFKKAINNYEHCLTKYGYKGFINDRGTTTNSLSNLAYKSSDSSTAILIVTLVSFVSVTAVGGYFFVRKRRYN